MENNGKIEMVDERFDFQIYRDFNQDLKCLSERELRTHFNNYGKNEPRIYARVNTTSQQISIKWLRGNGLEVGPGDMPCPLYGQNTHCDYADLSSESKFGSDNLNIIFNLNEPMNVNSLKSYDFVIASHVLEHLDGLLVGFENLIKLVRSSGIIYITLPTKDNDLDGHWLPDYDFNHHIQEYEDTNTFQLKHHDTFVSFVNNSRSNSVVSDAILTRVLRNDKNIYDQIISDNLISLENRYMYHKHSYSFHAWTEFMIHAANFFSNRVQLLDARFGHDRMDAHYVFKKN